MKGSELSPVVTNPQAHVQQPTGDSSDGDILTGAVGSDHVHAQRSHDLLDEIDDLLEDNAEEFVKSYVQKGGQ